MPEQILIELVSETSKFSPAIDQMLKLGQITAADVEIFKKQTAEFEKSTTALKKVGTEGQKQVKTLKDLNAGLEKVADAAITGIKKGMVDSLVQAGVSADDLKKKVTGLADSEEKAGSKTKSLRTELKELKQELALMEQAGDTTSSRFVEMAQRAGELSDQLGDTSQRVKHLGSDTRYLDTGIDVVKGLTAGFGAYQSVLALTGTENEEVVKTMQKLVAVQTLLNSLTEIKNLLQAQSSIMIDAGILKTKILTAVQTGYNVVVGTSTGLLKALRIALASTGVGLLVIGLGYLISKIIDWNSSTDTANDINKDLNRTLASQKQALENGDKAIERRIELLKAQAQYEGKLGSDLSKLDQQELYDKRDRRQKDIADLEQKINKVKSIYGDLTNKAFVNSIEDPTIKRLVLDQLNNKDFQKALEDRKKYGEELNALNHQIGINTLKISKEQDDEQKSADEKRLQKAKDAADKSREITERNLKAESELRQRYAQNVADTAKIVVDSEFESLNARLNALRANISARRDILEIQRAQELSNATLTQLEILNINDKYNGEQEQLDREAFSRSLAIRRQANEQILAEQQRLNEEIERAQQETNTRLNSRQSVDLDNYDALTAGALEFYQTVADNVRANLALRIDAINQIDRVEQTRINVEKTQLKDKYLRDISAAGLTADQLKDIEEKYQTDLQNIENKGVALHKKNEKAKTASTKEEAEKRKQIEAALKDAAFQVVQEVSDAIFEIGQQRRAAELEQSLNSLNATKDKELDNRNLTEQQKSNINEKYRQREAILKRQAAQKDKDAAVAQAVINAALAITKALTSLPPPFNFIQAAVVAASAAIQVAKIKSTPLPGFAKGTTNAPKGYAVVGESGPEIVYLSGGQKIYTHEQSKQIAASWSQRNLLPDLPISRSHNLQTSYNSNSTARTFDYDKLGKAVAKYMPAPVQNNINMDENGFTKNIMENGNKITIKNSRYSFK